jgi:hypothetical protein
MAGRAGLKSKPCSLRDDPVAMDGVAVTTERFGLSALRSGAGRLATAMLAAVLILAAVGTPACLAQAQSNTAAPAAALAPSGDATWAPSAQRPASAALPPAPNAPSIVPLPPQPPPPQLGGLPGQTPNQAQSQTPDQAQGPIQGQPPAQAPNPAADQAASLPAAPEGKRGFLNGLGQWWNDSIANFNAKMKEQQAKLEEFNKQQTAAAKDATQAMKNAADAMFTPAKVIEVQQPCPVAGNGAPDCASAATNVCKAKGFSDGHPMDIRTAERCKASLWVSGQAPTAADCPIETVLLRVACQP